MEFVQKVRVYRFRYWLNADQTKAHCPNEGLPRSSMYKCIIRRPQCTKLKNHSLEINRWHLCRTGQIYQLRSGSYFCRLSMCENSKPSYGMGLPISQSQWVTMYVDILYLLCTFAKHSNWTKIVLLSNFHRWRLFDPIFQGIWKWYRWNRAYIRYTLNHIHG